MTTPGTVLIAGARGRFGRHATAAFAEAGWRVRALTRSGARGFENAEPLAGDALDPAALTRAAQGADVIVNALNAPYPAWSSELPRATRALLAAARATGATLLHPGNVYGYGSAIPARTTPETPYRPDTRKGRLRAEQEMRLRAAAEAGEIRCIVLRGGDFLDTEIAGNWFDSHMTAGIERGRFVYPGPLNQVHAWSFLPDFAAIAAGLAARRADLAPFAAFNHPGHALTGAEPHRLEDPRLAALLPGHVPTSAEAAVAAALAPRLEGGAALRSPLPVPGARPRAA